MPRGEHFWDDAAEFIPERFFEELTKDKLILSLWSLALEEG